MKHDLREALGYFELGMFDDAWSAIEELPLRRLNDVDVLALRFEVLAATQQWDYLASIARNSARAYPEEARLAELGAEAIAHTEGQTAKRAFIEEIQQARILRAERLYQMACEELKAGNLQKVGALIRSASELNPALKRKALDDPDLEEWWESM
ncbi:MAG: hypothetical protein AAF357_04390 [Verrucomicrobiota bacterium]